MAAALGSPESPPGSVRPQNSKRYKISRRPFVRNIEIRPESNDEDDEKSKDSSPPAFVIETSNFTRHKANLTLHAGPDTSESSPTVARTFMPAFSRHFKVGVCSPAASPEDMEWEEMRVENLRASEWSLQVNLDGGETRRRLHWKRTSHVAVDGQKARRANHNWKLIDEENYGGGEEKRVVAVFTSATRRTTSGTLQFNVDWGSSFENVVMITLLALYGHLPQEQCEQHLLT